MKRINPRNGGAIVVYELYGASVVGLSNKHNEFVKVILSREEVLSLIDKLEYSVAKNRSIDFEEPPDDRCMHTHSVNHWPFTARCIRHMNGHKGKECVDKYGYRFIP